MSLLLNALKKAEEGEKDPATEGAAGQQPQGQDGKPAVAATSSAGVAAPAGAALKTAAGASPVGVAAKPTAAAAPSSPAAVDFDAIEEEEDKPAAGVTAGGKAPPPPAAVDKRTRVDAARVFGASLGGDDAGASSLDAGGGGGGSRKLIYSLVAAAVAGGGVYFVIVSGVIPGVDMRAIANLIGLQEPQVATTQPQSSEVELEISDDVVLLPVPAVDIQSKVDFAALRLPENNRARIGEAEYMQRIAYLTGFDFDKERTRAQDEQRELIVELDISLVEEDPEPELEVEEQGLDVAVFGDGLDSGVGDIVVSDRPIYNADSSREDKLRLESSTPSDRVLANAIVSDAFAASEASESSDAAVAETAVAQAPAVEVKQSQEGAERKRMIQQAQALYHRGAYLEAEVAFRNVLAASPTSRDALRGIAQIALVTGRYQVAVVTYLELLSLYPNDPIAIAELTNLRGDGGDFYEMEKALRGALGKMPAADGRLYFSLGNLYAQNGRLRDAQQAYFDAFSRESDNADYAYNLAVLLDHLNKPVLAARYYAEALRLSQGSPVGFSRAEVRARIKDIQ